MMSAKMKISIAIGEQGYSPIVGSVFYDERLLYCLPEVVRSRLLSKSRSWNDADASGLQKMKCIEDISWLSSLLGCCKSLLWELDLGKCVHGSLDSVASDSLE